MPAHLIRFFIQNPAVVAELVQTVGRAESGRSRSDDDNFLARHNFVVGWLSSVFISRPGEPAGFAEPNEVASTPWGPALQIGHFRVLNSTESPQNRWRST